MMDGASLEPSLGYNLISGGTYTNWYPYLECLLIPSRRGVQTNEVLLEESYYYCSGVVSRRLQQGAEQQIMKDSFLWSGS